METFTTCVRWPTTFLLCPVQIPNLPPEACGGRPVGKGRRSSGDRQHPGLVSLPDCLGAPDPVARCSPAPLRAESQSLYPRNSTRSQPQLVLDKRVSTLTRRCHHRPGPVTGQARCHQLFKSIATHPHGHPGAGGGAVLGFVLEESQRMETEAQEAEGRSGC